MRQTGGVFKKDHGYAGENKKPAEESTSFLSSSSFAKASAGKDLPWEKSLPKTTRV